VLTLYRRNLITLDEAENQLAAVAREQADVRGLLDGLAAQEALTQAAETHLAEAGALLGRLRDRLEEVDQTQDSVTKRTVAELLVSHIGVRTTGQKHSKQAVLTIRYAFGSPTAVASSTRTSTSSPAPATTRGRSCST
jgi:hypothetical protein